MNKKTLGKIAVVVVLAAGALVAYATLGWKAMGPVNSLKLDLTRPDALIRTQSLAQLPRDLLTIPLARDVLREDFLFYYEQSEDRLGLKGTLRRIAYEHELGWGDQLIRMVLDEPAEVALWRDGDGSLKHYAIAVSRNSFTKLLEEAGKIALKDTQMTLAGEVRVDGDKVPVYALDYAYRRTFLLAARGSRLVILSHPGMLYGEDKKTGDGAAEAAVARLLSADKGKQAVFRNHFNLTDDASTVHSVAVKTHFLSFSYQPFFAALDALRFDFGKGGWQTRVLIDAKALKPGALDNSALWKVMPHDPSACFALPVDWSKAQPVLDKLGAKAQPGLTALAEQFTGPAAVCWYGNSRLYTPVFVATQKGKADMGALFQQLFNLGIAPMPADVSAPQQPTAAKRGKKGEQIWQRRLNTRYGNHSEGDSAFLLPTLAVQGQTVVFSPDDKLVEQVLAVLRKQAPAVADTLPDVAHTAGVISPAALSALAQKEAFASLPAAEESVLRGAANAHLLPRLSALKKYPPFRLVLKAPPAGGQAWVPLEWQAAER